MKIAVLIARVLLGLLFFVFGLNGILHFIPMPAMPPSDATTFSTILAASGFMKIVSLIMIVAGLLLLVARYVPLALVLLGPVLVNILLFHICLEGGKGIGIGVFATVLELFLMWSYRLSFRRLFDAAPEVV